jgi:hypothetical protein
VQDGRVIRVVWQVRLFELVQLRVKGQVVWIAEPATEKAEVAVAGFFEEIEDVVA